MEALPNGAAETALMACSVPTGTTGCVGRKGARCLAAHMGLRHELDRSHHIDKYWTYPTPGPPPP